MCGSLRTPASVLYCALTGEEAPLPSRSLQCQAACTELPCVRVEKCMRQAGRTIGEREEVCSSLTLGAEGVSVVQMLFNSGPLLAVIIIDMAALLMYNFSGMCVTGERAMSIDACRKWDSSICHSLRGIQPRCNSTTMCF